jgi:pimeloyl-ACP methyl ester carboxylesterase/DNA-binding SARP family transcriptional activator
MQVCILGSIRIRTTAGTIALPHGSKQRLLLAALVLHAPRIVPSDRLMDILWGDALPDDPPAALRTQVSRLRSLLMKAGAASRLRRGEFSGYGIELAATELDAAVFEALILRARTADTPELVLSLTDEALGLWQGEPYGEFADVACFLGEISRLRELWLTAGELRTQALLATGRHADALATAAALIDADPLRERSRALSMQVLHQAGRQHEALAAFQEYRRLLAEELGLTPSPALREMEAEIMRRPVSPPLAVPPAARGTRPGARDLPAPHGPILLDGDLRQDIRFARSRDGVRLAYATVGSGTPLVKAANWLNHLEFDWESPVWRRLFRELAMRHTLIRYDERACGLSDPDPPVMSLDAWVLDLECIVDACGLDRFALLGISQGCAVSIEYAARHPERVSALILHGGYAAGWREDPSFGEAEIARRDASIEIVRHGWGEDTPAYRQMFTQTFIPGGTHEEIEWFNELQRRTVTPENAARFMETFAHIDVRHRLADVQAPALVLHSRGDQRIRFELGLELATGIPDARFVPLDSANHLILEHEPAFDVWVDEVKRFLDSDTVMSRA